MEIIIGATSKIAKEYITHLSGRNIESVLISRSGGGHIKQDLTCSCLGNLKSFLKGINNSRIIYFAATNTSLKDLSIQDHCAVNSYPIPLILSLVKQKNIQFIYISSDMVFGTENKPCDENTIPSCPWSNYAISKRKGEQATLEFPNGLVVRFGNVLGMKGDFLTGVVNSLRQDKNYCAWTNVKNRFTSIDDINLVLDGLGDYSGEQRIFHVASTNSPLSRYDISKKFALMCECKELLLPGSSEKIKGTKADLSDGRPEILALCTEITSKELKFKPSEIMVSLCRRIETTDYPFF
jgi:dTDP-4-dehydrorhamnose reductase